MPALMLSVAFYTFADLGLISSVDGVFFAVASSLFKPRWAPCLLVLLISVHDSPGMATPSLYLGVAGVAMSMILHDWKTSQQVIHQPGMLGSIGRPVTLMLRMVFWMTLYGIVMSFLQDNLFGREQSADRNYALVGLLMLGMAISAYVACRRLVADAAMLKMFRMVCMFALAHIILVALMQILYGPMFGASSRGMLEISSASQLIDISDRGISRLTGPFLTPNNLAYVPAAILLMILWTIHSKNIPTWFLLVYISAGNLLALLGASRSMMVFFCLTSGIMTWYKSRLMSSLLIAFSFGVIILMSVNTAEMTLYTRMENLDFTNSTRHLLWQSVIEDFQLHDWLFGVGLTHWDFLFYHVYSVDRVSDPHNWILSVVGMFGVLGLLFYLRFAYYLANVYWGTGMRTRRAMALSIFILFFLRDFIGVQYIFNNHPNACLSWLLVCLVFSTPMTVQGKSDFQFSRDTKKGIRHRGYAKAI
ncbi:MAG: O-antigen ligase family protein [Pirellulales bacterium]